MKDGNETERWILYNHAGTTWPVMWMTDKSVDGTVGQVQNCDRFQTSNAIKCGISLVLSRYRVGTPTLFGSQRPAIDPNITASALELLAQDS